MSGEAGKAEILVVDDARETLQLLCRMLYKHGYDVRPANDGTTALSSARNDPPDLALVDVSMSGINGYELCRLLKGSPETEEVPVIFVSALDDVRNKVKGFEVGAVDYITKPFQFQDVLARIGLHLSLSRKIRELTLLREQAMHQYETISEINDEVLQHVIHDIRNPLHVISLNLTLLKKQLPESDERIDEYLKRIDRNLQLVNRIIADCIT